VDEGGENGKIPGDHLSNSKKGKMQKRSSAQRGPLIERRCCSGGGKGPDILHHFKRRDVLSSRHREK